MRMLRIFMAALAALCLTASSQAALVQGKDYNLLSPPQPAEPGPKVEVIEFFAYYCPHCNSLDPELGEWVRTHADKINFKRIHVSESGEPMAQQRLYYALEAMGNIEQYHAKIFALMHAGHVPVNNDPDAIDLAVRRLGIDRTKFLSFYNSFAVDAKVRQAIQAMQKYQVTGWPLIVMDGKYVTSPTIAGSRMAHYEEPGGNLLMLKVMDELVDQLAAKRQ